MVTAIILLDCMPKQTEKNTDINMKSFKEYLIDSLNDKQKEKLGIYYDNTPRPAAKELSKHVLPNDGGGSINVPLSVDTKEDVKHHLEKHGFELSNYSEGKAKDKHGREVSIGSVLKSPKTAAPDTLVKGFENDDRNSKITKDTHHILFSNIPVHIGEVSTNKKWKSCAGLTPAGRFTPFGGGAAAKQIPDAIKAGSHVAYLMPKDKHDANDAAARILLHPYHSYDKNGDIDHSVLMPERKVYSASGGKNSDFHNSLEKFAREKYPMKEGKIYIKDPSVYDDDGQRIRFNTSPNSVKKILTGGWKEGMTHAAKESAMQAVQLPAASITAVLNHPRTQENWEGVGEGHQAIASHQKLSDAHVDKLLELGRGTHLAGNKKLTKTQVGKIANYRPERFAGESDSEKEVSDMANDAQDRETIKAHVTLLRTHSDKIKPEHIKTMISHPAITASNLEMVARNISNPEVQKAILNHPKVDDGALWHIARSTRNPEVHKAILNHPKVDADTLSEINSTDPEIHKAILNKRDGDGKVLANGTALRSVAENTTDPEVHKAVLKHPNAVNSTFRSVAENTTDPEVHKAILKQRPDLGSDLIHTIATHTADPEVHKAIAKLPQTGYTTLDTVARYSNDPEVHKAIVNHPMASSAVLDSVANRSKNPEVHKAIMKHPKVSADILRTIYNSTNTPEIYKAVHDHPEWKSL
jgi:hypothetical protein